MDNLDDSKSFFKHVFNFDDNSKSDVLNILQYVFVSIIPIIGLNKLMSKYIPEADDTKGNLIIIFEVIIQVVVIFIGLLLIHRITTFIPTYSGEKYPEFHIIYIILAILLIILSLQTKIGEKVNILINRLTDLWNGTTNDKNKKKGKQNGNNGSSNGIKISQPISNSMDGTSINSLPTDLSMQQTNGPSQQLPNYDNMYRQDTNPLVNAATPSDSMLTENMTNEPLAANALLGNNFGTW